jgi:hypothetical protein
MIAEIKKKIQKFDSRNCTYEYIIYCMLNIFNIVNDLQWFYLMHVKILWLLYIIQKFLANIILSG